MAKENFLNFERFFSFFPIHIYLIDNSGYYQACNDLQARDFGLKNKENIIGKTNYSLPILKNHPDIVDILEKNNKLVFSEKKPLEFYEPFPKSNGRLGQCKSYKIPIFDKNQLIGLIGLSFDLTNETKALDQLKSKIEQKEIELSNILDNLPEHIYWVDRNNIFLGCNANQAKDFGFKDSSEIIGLHVSNFQTKENAQKIIKNNIKIIESGNPITAEENFLNNKGENVFYLSKKVPLKNKNEIIGVLGISFDITELKNTEKELILAKEKAEAANQAKSEFLRNMEHQLRPPFCGIYTMVGMFAQSETDPEKKMGLEETSKSAKELLDLLNEIIDFSRNKTDKVSLIIKKFDLKETLEKAIIIEKPAARVKNLTITYFYPDIPTIFLGDARCVQRIVLNLLDNAIKFTHTGEIKLEVKLAKKIDEKNLILQLIVSDTGIGIEKDKQQFIYEKFYRGHPANQNQYSGAGLGLYIVKELMDMLEGEIDVVSEPSKSSSFICTLPFKRPLLDELINTDI